MKLYYAVGACSLSDHIALLEAGANFEAEAVDLHTKRTASGRDFVAINPKGYVPALVFDDGEVITENVAVLDWIGDQYPHMRHEGVMARTRQLEMLAFIAAEIHHTFEPLWHAVPEDEKQAARARLARLMQIAAMQVRGDYLFGPDLSVADCYLFVMLRWAERFGIAVPDALLRLQWRMLERPAVQAAIAAEEMVPTAKAHPMEIDSKVRENAAQHRFERPIHDGVIAAAYYRDADGKLVFIHTEVPSEFSGQGIASDLARGTFELLRASKRKAVLRCPFMVDFASHHPEYADVVDG